MDTVSLLISLVSGVLGGNAAGATMKERSLGTVGNSLSGLLGGGLGALLLPALGMAVQGQSGLDIGSLIGNIAGGGIGGAVLTIIVGFLKNAVAAKSH